MSSAAVEQAPSTPKKFPSKTPVKKTPKKVQQSAPEPRAEPELQDSQKEQHEDDDNTNLTNGYGDETEDAADNTQGRTDDAADEGEEAAEDVEEGTHDAADDGDEPESIAEGAKSHTGDTGEVAEDEAESTKNQAEDQAGNAKGQTEGAKDDLEGVTDDAQQHATDPEEKAEDAQGTAAAAAGEGAEQLQGTSKDAKDQAEKGAKGVKSQVEEDASDTKAQAEDGASTVNAQAEDNADYAKPQADEQVQGITEDAKGQPKDAKSQAAEIAEEIPGAEKEQADGTQNQAEDAMGGAQGQLEGATNETQGEGTDVVPIGKVGEDGKSILSDSGGVVGQISKGEPPAGSIVDQEGDVMDAEGNVIGAAEPNADNAGEQAEAIQDEAGGANQDPSDKVEGAGEETAQQKPQFEAPLTSDAEGAIKDKSGKVIGNLNKDELKKLGDKEISDVDGEGNLLDKDGDILAKADLAQETLDQLEEASKNAKEKPEFSGLLEAGKDGAVKDETGKIIANLNDDELKKLGKQKIADVDGEGHLLDKDGNIIATAKIPVEQELDYSVLKGLKVNKAGNVNAEDGTVIGKLVHGDAAKLSGNTCDEEGRIWNDSGKQIGQAEPLPESERQSLDGKPFEDFQGAIVERSGDVTFEGRVVGKLVEGDKKQCEGKQVDVDGDVSDKNGNTIGRAERLEDEAAPEEEAPVEIDYSVLLGHKVNKAGAIVNEADGTPLGKVVEGELKHLIGKQVFKEGKIYNDGGDVIGRAEPIPENERVTPKDSPFEDFQPSLVQKSGDVNFNDQKVGEVSEGDPKKLAGKQVDPDGDIVDKSGSVIGKAVRWEEPEAEEAVPVDNSALAGKRVNKQGYVADPSSGMLYGRVVEGDPKKLQGKMCDKDGNIWDEGGNKVGRAELIPESEREGSKNGPFTDFQPCTVTKDGTCVDAAQNIVGRLTEGDGKTLYGKQVDEDGDVNDNNGNKIGKAERWEPEAKAVDKHAAAGFKVNKEGNVINSDGDIIAKLTSGDIAQCRGKEIDEDGNVVDGKGKQVGYVTLIEDVKEEEPSGPSQEELDAQNKKEEEEAVLSAEQKKDRDLAKRLGYEIDQTFDRIKPILKEMTEYIDEAEGKDPKDVDEDKLVENVKPLIHKAGDILEECNQNIRGMDPDGRIQSKAKQNAGSGEASPEEQHLAEGLKTLTGSVQDTIDSCKKKIAKYPHAKEELNPLWSLMSEPLFQILAAVGLLLSGVLGLVGKLLGGLGLGGIVDSVLGGLGISSILDGAKGLLGA